VLTNAKLRSATTVAEGVDVSKQFKNGRCSCWKQVDDELGKKGVQLAKAFNLAGHEFLEIKTERTDGKRKQPHRIVCSFCPFCGSKLP
jgi:hypothetical protein